MKRPPTFENSWGSFRPCLQQSPDLAAPIHRRLWPDYRPAQSQSGLERLSVWLPLARRAVSKVVSD